MPVQQADLVPGLIDENIYLSIIGIKTRIIVHQTRQGIKALAHIRGMTVQMKSVFNRKCKHGYGFNSVFSTPE